MEKNIHPKLVWRVSCTREQQHKPTSDFFLMPEPSLFSQPWVYPSAERGLPPSDFLALLTVVTAVFAKKRVLSVHWVLLPCLQFLFKGLGWAHSYKVPTSEFIQTESGLLCSIKDCVFVVFTMVDENPPGDEFSTGFLAL